MPFVREGSGTVNLLIVDCNMDIVLWDDTINTRATANASEE